MTDRHPVDALCHAASSSQGSRAALVSRHVLPSFVLRAASRLVRLHDDATTPEGMLPDGVGRVLVLAPGQAWLRKEMVGENDGWLAREGGKGRHAKVLDRTDIKCASQDSKLPWSCIE